MCSRVGVSDGCQFSAKCFDRIFQMTAASSHARLALQILGGAQGPQHLVQPQAKENPPPC